MTLCYPLEDVGVTCFLLFAALGNAVGIKLGVLKTKTPKTPKTTKTSKLENEDPPIFSFLFFFFFGGGRGGGGRVGAVSTKWCIVYT